MINKAALEKVKTAKMKGESFATILEDLNLTLDVTGAAETSITFDYQHDDIKVERGDLIPFITIGLRQATMKIAIEDEKIGKDGRDGRDGMESTDDKDAKGDRK